MATNRDDFIGELWQEGRGICVSRKYDFGCLDRTTFCLDRPVSVTRRRNRQHGGIRLKVQRKPIDAEAEKRSDKLIRPERARWIRRRRMSIDASGPEFRIFWIRDPFDYIVDFTPVCSEFPERCIKIIGALLIQRNI